MFREVISEITKKGGRQREFTESLMRLLTLFGIGLLTNANITQATTVQPEVLGNHVGLQNGEDDDTVTLSPDSFYITNLYQEGGGTIGIISLISTEGDPDEICAFQPQLENTELLPNYFAPSPPLQVNTEGDPTKFTIDSILESIQHINDLVIAVGLTNEQAIAFPQYTALGNPLCMNFEEEFLTASTETTNPESIQNNEIHITFDREFIQSEVLNRVLSSTILTDDQKNLYREYVSPDRDIANTTTLDEREQNILFETIGIIEQTIINKKYNEVQNPDNDSYDYFYQLAENISAHPAFKRAAAENIIVQVYVPEDKFPPGIIGLNLYGNTINFVSRKKISNPNLFTHENVHDFQWAHVPGGMNIFHFVMDPKVSNDTMFLVISGPTVNSSIVFGHMNGMPEWAIEQLKNEEVQVSQPNSTADAMIANIHSTTSGIDSGEATNREPAISSISLKENSEGRMVIRIQFDNSKLNSVTSNISARIGIPATDENKNGLTHEFQKIEPEEFFNSTEVVMSNTSFLADSNGLLEIIIPEEFINPERTIYIPINFGGRQVIYSLDYPEQIYDVEMVNSEGEILDPTPDLQQVEIPTLHSEINLAQNSFGSLTELISTILPDETVTFIDSKNNKFTCHIDESKADIVVCNELGEKFYLPLINDSGPVGNISNTDQSQSPTGENILLRRKDPYKNKETQPQPSHAFRNYLNGGQRHI